MLPGHGAQVSCLRFLSSGDNGQEALITGDEAGTLNVWRTSGTAKGGAYEVVHSVRAHDGSIGALGAVRVASGSEKGEREDWVLSGGSDACVNVWKWVRRGDGTGGERVLGSGCSGHGLMRAAEMIKIQTLNMNGRLPLDMALHVLPSSSGKPPSTHLQIPGLTVPTESHHPRTRNNRT